MVINNDEQKDIIPKLIQEIIYKAEQTGCEVISFDIFGTIILRNCIDYCDVFDAVGERLCDTTDARDFKSKRIIAERDARKSATKEDVTLTEIYSYLTYSEEVKKKSY